MMRLVLALTALAATHPSDPFADWEGSVAVRGLAPGAQRHSIHTYFNFSDGTWTEVYVAELR